MQKIIPVEYAGIYCYIRKDKNGAASFDFIQSKAVVKEKINVY